LQSGAAFQSKRFSLQGIDGRGRQQLVRDPRNNRGTAVVRIEDPKGASGGYTGDIMWWGGNGGDSAAIQ
jgi:hypothetical protein